jgi:hypothetical protein
MKKRLPKNKEFLRGGDRRGAPLSDRSDGFERGRRMGLSGDRTPKKLHSVSQRGGLTILIALMVLVLLGLLGFAVYTTKEDADKNGKMTAQALPSPTIPELDYEDCNDPYNYDCKEEAEGDDVDPADLMGPD